MNKSILFAFLPLVAASSLFAAGVDWSYKGTVPYQAALIVWTDTGINHINTKKDIEDQRMLVLSTLNDESKPSTLESLTKLCQRTQLDNYILVHTTAPASNAIRVNHDRLYAFERTGYGFSLLLNFDADGYVSEYAINEITSADIQSEAIDDTKLVIHDSDLMSAVSAYASRRLLSAGAPVISAHHDTGYLIEPQANEQTRGRGIVGDTFVFDITNAVNGFTYHVIASDSPTNAFTSCGVDVFASADGRLTFTVPIDPTERVKFYRVQVADQIWQ